MKEIRTYNSLFNQWDELSAYILGFWFADGSISCAYRKFTMYKRWRLHNNDRQILNIIANKIGAQITKGSTSKKSKNICYQIQLHSDVLFDFCYELVGTTNKSGRHPERMKA